MTGCSLQSGLIRGVGVFSECRFHQCPSVGASDLGRSCAGIDRRSSDTSTQPIRFPESLHQSDSYDRITEDILEGTSRAFDKS